MEKEKILIKIQHDAGIIPGNLICSSCETFIGISDALALFPHSTSIQNDVRELLDAHNPDNCKQDNKTIQCRCE